MTDQSVPKWRGPAPKPADASVAARRLIDLANRVPGGKWVSYGDLAEAYTKVHRQNMVARGVASALSLLPIAAHVEERRMVDPQPRVDQWHVPWHRIRLADGRAISRKHGVVRADDYVNRMLTAEGGTMRHGAATDNCRFNLVASLRVEGSSPPTSPGLTDEQRARLAARARERQERLCRE
jgi:alkylated DNA nucleotide flippase Atl1